jgi:hypothetical protein
VCEGVVVSSLNARNCWLLGLLLPPAAAAVCGDRVLVAPRIWSAPLIHAAAQLGACTVSDRRAELLLLGATHQVGYVLNGGDAVVVQLQLAQLVKASQVLDARYVFEAERQALHLLERDGSSFLLCDISICSADLCGEERYAARG